MAEKQLTQEELNEIKTLQQQVKEVTGQLGSLEVRKIQLQDMVLKLQQKEEQVAKQLSDKYGVGTLDIDTGKLTLSQN
jgi:predicted nuclease with TOPRIM domain